MAFGGDELTMDSDGRKLDAEEILQGFLYANRQLDAGMLKVYEASAYIYALVELLVAKGLIGIEELDARKKIVEKRLAQSFQEANLGLKIQTPEIDKYSLENEVHIDCAERFHVCRGACCKLGFLLSWQDVQEGIRWDLGRPFLIARGADGYCVHFDRKVGRCRIYERRPAVCRLFDCRNDRRIWIDFEEGIINPNLLEAIALSKDAGPSGLEREQTDRSHRS